MLKFVSKYPVYYPHDYQKKNYIQSATDQEVRGCVMGFFSSGESFHDMYGVGISVFPPPFTMLCFVLGEGPISAFIYVVHRNSSTPDTATRGGKERQVFKCRVYYPHILISNIINLKLIRIPVQIQFFSLEILYYMLLVSFIKRK